MVTIPSTFFLWGEDGGVGRWAINTQYEFVCFYLFSHYCSIQKLVFLKTMRGNNNDTNFRTNTKTTCID